MSSDWRHEWKGLQIRFVAWRRAAESFLSLQSEGLQHTSRASDMLVMQALSLLNRMRSLAVPEHVKRASDVAAFDIEALSRETQGARALIFQMVALDTLAAPILEEYARSDAAQRSLVDRAFVHLRRTLVVDSAERERWTVAFARGEPSCEKLGAVHLLLHGVYGFKADAAGGRTDLILSDRLRVDADVTAAAALVLTEWKLVRDPADAQAKLEEAIVQAARYSESEVVGLELRSARYAVLVSMKSLHGLVDETRNGVLYRVVNVVVDPDSPSEESRQAAALRREA